MARYLFFSDLDLSDGGAIDNFGFEKRILFLNFIKAIKKSNINGIFAIGDIYELWQGIGSARKRLKRAKGTYPKITDFLHTDCLELIGNHDRARKKLDKIPSSRLVEADGVKIWLEHGDRFDRHCNKESSVGRIAAELFSVLERLFGKKSKKIQEFVERYLAKITPASSCYSGDLSEYEAEAKKLFEEKDYDIVILGHTHKFHQKEWEDLKGRRRVYLNSGAWVDDHSDYIIVDTIKRNYQISSYHNQKRL